MSSPVVQATLQACILTGTSNILAQWISAYRSDVRTYSHSGFNSTDITSETVHNRLGPRLPVRSLHSAKLPAKLPLVLCCSSSVLFDFLTFYRQQFLESAFPGFTVQPSTSAIAAAAASDEKELDAEQKSNKIVESRLNVANTLYKFVLDQTVGAALNTVMFSFVIAGFQGADFNQAVQITKQDFWPLVQAGWKLWPAVSALNYTLVKTVEGRTLVGSLAGMGWSIYLSLMAGAARD